MGDTTESSERNANDDVAVVMIDADGPTWSPALTSVVVCMTVMVVSAVIYFAIRCYFEERKLRSTLRMCKCGPVALANAIECGNLCCYNERRAVNVAVQTGQEPPQQQPTVACWTTSDIRMSDARRTGCTFSSPLANNQSAPPGVMSSHGWRQPASGSSRRQSTHHLSMNHRSSRCHKHQRRSRSMLPSINVNSPSSSDSYSILTNNSKSAGIKDLTAVTFSDEEEERIMSQRRISTVMEATFVSPFHPRYNTPVSEGNEDMAADELVSKEEDEEELHNSHRPREPIPKLEMEEKDSLNVGGTSSNRSAGDGLPDDAGLRHQALKGDVVTQSFSATTTTCAAMKRSLTTGSLVATAPLPIDTVRFGPPAPGMKGRSPSFEILPGGHLITRWTQTDNGSLASLDWDPYEYERLRTADVFGDDDLHQAMNSGTLLMASHASDTTLHASRASQSARSASSPYVLCFECSEDFSMNDHDRRLSTSSFLGRRTTSTSSPNPPSARLVQQQQQAAPPGPPTPVIPSSAPSPLTQPSRQMRSHQHRTHRR